MATSLSRSKRPSAASTNSRCRVSASAPGAGWRIWGAAGARCSIISGRSGRKESGSRSPPPRRPPAGATGSTCTYWIVAASPRTRSAGSTRSRASARSSTSARRRNTAPAAAVLPPRGRFYLQTMVFGRNMIPAERISLDAPRDSDEFHLALMGKQFPGSWLPYGAEQVERAADPYFRLVDKRNGRLDYIETIRQWRLRFAAPGVRKTLLKLRLLPRYLLSADFRYAFTSGVSANTVCFERELLDHFRLVFEKR